MTPEDFERKLAELNRKINFLTQRLDETRRRVNLSSIIDEQQLAINSRITDRETAA